MEDLRGIDQTNRRLRMFGFGLFAAIYFLSFLQRVAVSVVADDLAMELGLDSVALGFMSSGFFIAYALVQPAMGLLCDMAGPERVSAGALVIAAVGSFLFAGARGFIPAFLGRIFMAQASQPEFIPGMKVIAAMFPPEAFSTYNGLFVAIGERGHSDGGGAAGVADGHGRMEVSLRRAGVCGSAPGRVVLAVRRKRRTGRQRRPIPTTSRYPTEM